MLFKNLESLFQFIDSKKGKSAPPSAFFLMPDSFEKEEASSYYIDYLKSQEYEVRRVAISELQEATMPLFSFEKKLCFFVDIDEKLNKDEAGIVEESLKDSSHLIFIASVAPVASAKEIEKRGGFYAELPPGKPWEQEGRMGGWILWRLRKSGKSIEPLALKLLSRTLAPHSNVAKEEIEKLLIYTIDKEKIGLADVMAIVTIEERSVVWQLGEAILLHNVEEALRIVHDALAHDAHPLQLLRLVRNTIHSCLFVATLKEKNASFEEIASTLPSIRPKTLEKYDACCNEYGRAGLEAALCAVDALEMELKNSTVDEELALEKLVIHLCCTSCLTS
jgi:DNA polymerase III subunit delta